MSKNIQTAVRAAQKRHKLKGLTRVDFRSGDNFMNIICAYKAWSRNGERKAFVVSMNSFMGTDRYNIYWPGKEAKENIWVTK